MDEKKYDDRDLAFLMGLAMAKRNIGTAMRATHETFGDLEHTPIPTCIMDDIDEYRDACNEFIVASRKFAEVIEDISYDIAYHGGEVFDDGEFKLERND